MARYEIQLATSDVKNAGSDARFYITLNGTRGSSAETQIDNSADNFERNHLDFFHVDSPLPLGDIQSIRLRHDNSGDKPGWHGRYIIVRELGSTKPYIARIDRWLAVTEGDRRTDITINATEHQPSDSMIHSVDYERFRFKFPNSFANPLPFLGFHWGFCGGMSAGFLYRWRRNIAAPATTTTPAPGSSLYNELLNRQIESLSPRLVGRMLEFQMSPDKPSDYKPHTIGHHTKQNWADKLRPNLRISPTVMVLILADGNDSPAKNHQVLATGYRWFSDTKDLLISAYDCNDPDGKMELIFNLQRSDIKGRFMDGRHIRGFFWNENTSRASD